MRKKFVWLSFILLFYTQIYASELSLGICVGKPSGLNLKLWLTSDNALNFILGEVYNDLSASLDYLNHNYKIVQSTELTGKMPLFYGLGIKILKDNIGMRIPFGIEYIFKDIPISLSFEFAPYVLIIKNFEVNFENFQPNNCKVVQINEKNFIFTEKKIE